MRFEDPTIDRIAVWLEEIGIPVAVCPLEQSFLPGVSVREGGLLVDPTRLKWPGDLLHEAGHIAVTDPSARPSLDSVADDPGDEMAAIAWSYAAAVEIGLDARILFHDDYRGGGAALADNFTNGRDVGVPMLQYFGMTAGRRTRGNDDPGCYPNMQRWLR
jgi:hypothetical protein